VLSTYALVKLLHLLLFVYWLGGDIGVFYSARFVRDPGVSLDGRRTALRIMQWVDMIPRYCLVLIAPVGFTLAATIGAADLRPAALGAIWVVALVWLANVAAIHHYQGTPLGERLRRIDLVWRVLVIAALAWTAVAGLAGSGFVHGAWLSAKLLILALLVFCGLMIRVRGAPVGPALRAVLTEGSTPEREAVLARSFGRTRPFVLAIWAGLVVAAWVAIAKP
jgi:uncharacterized membrane protein